MLDKIFFFNSNLRYIHLLAREITFSKIIELIHLENCLVTRQYFSNFALQGILK